MTTRDSVHMNRPHAFPARIVDLHQVPPLSILLHGPHPSQMGYRLNYGDPHWEPCLAWHIGLMTA